MLLPLVEQATHLFAAALPLGRAFGLGGDVLGLGHDGLTFGAGCDPGLSASHGLCLSLGRHLCLERRQALPQAVQVTNHLGVAHLRREVLQGLGDVLARDLRLVHACREQVGVTGELVELAREVLQGVLGRGPGVGAHLALILAVDDVDSAVLAHSTEARRVGVGVHHRSHGGRRRLGRHPRGKSGRRRNRGRGPGCGRGHFRGLSRGQLASCGYGGFGGFGRRRRTSRFDLLGGLGRCRLGHVGHGWAFFSVTATRRMLMGALGAPSVCSAPPATPAAMILSTISNPEVTVPNTEYPSGS